MTDAKYRPLVLASASPRRAELLHQIGVGFTSCPANIDESPLPYESAESYVVRVAQCKAQHVAALASDRQSVVLGADTAVVHGNEILGKPRDCDDAARMLRTLSDGHHEVFSGVAFVQAGELANMRSIMVRTKVYFRRLHDTEIDAYVASGEPLDKAGAYGIQGLAGAFVTFIEGSYSNVVGLPLAETCQHLASYGVKTGLS
ncbi:MAG: Maf family protein [Gammaproteobacteria bacterium]